MAASHPIMAEKADTEKQEFGLQVDKLSQRSQSPQEQEAEARLERRLKLKLDFVILPCIALGYFLATIGRTDIANANTAGLSKDLGLSPHQYSNVASILNVGYILFQIPGALLIRKIGPPYQLAGAMILWGVITVCHIKATTYGTLIGLRILVGVAEAFFDGAVFYISWWYTFTELATRGGIFYSMAALAGSFNGLIAYAIQKNLNGRNGWTAWQWLYLVEGILPIGCAFILLIFLPHHPEKRHWIFTKEEQELAVRRSRRSFNPVDAKIRWKAIIDPLLEVRFWPLAAMYAFNHFVTGALKNFLPAIIQGFGYSAVRSQLLSVIVYACAFVGINFFAHVADKLNRRGLTLLMAVSVTIVGYVVLLAVENYKARLAATCIVAFGVFSTIPICSTWLTTNIAGYTRRGSAAAMINMIAQAFAISGTQAYSDPPYYRRGNGASLGLMGAHVVATLIMLWIVKRANVAKEKLRSELSPEELQGRKAESWDVLGDRHIDFNYGY